MIYLIVNCTNSKRIEATDNMVLENYDFQNFNKTLELWKNNSILKNSKSIEAKSLYKGHSWKESLNCQIILSKKFQVKLLISSAGYGLIDEYHKINSYQATFSKSNKNSIHNFKNNILNDPTIKWWDNINEFNLSGLDKNAYLFINVSYEYLIAMQNTIEKLIDIFKNKLFIIVLSKEKLPNIYNKNILNFDTRFNTFEKGTMNSIIPRFTRWLFKEIVEHSITFNHQEIQKHINNFLSNFSTYKIPERKQLSEKELFHFINKQIKVKNIISKSKGLRDLRSEGFACSQDRYGKLFTELKESYK